MSEIKIFLPSDNNYAPFVATTIAGICVNTSSDVDFYVLDGGITEENKEKIKELNAQFKNFSVEFLRVDVDKYFKDFVCPAQFTKSTYNRFLLPRLKPEIGKILYLDSDIVVNGDIKELFDIDLGRYLMAAVPENCSADPVILECYNRLGLSKGHKYFNAGVMLLDNKKWIENGIDKKLFETELQYRDRILWADQDVLNVVFDNNYKPLDEKYNWMTHKNSSNPDALIRHYNTYIKPWNLNPELKTSIISNIEDFWFYLKYTPFYETVLDKVKDINEQKSFLMKLRMEKMRQKMTIQKGANDA